jgi:ketosteroid isomerase-like protein
MTEDYRITSAGLVIEGREAFKAWVVELQRQVSGATNEHLDLFADGTGSKVVSRWITRGRNNGIFGLAPDDSPIEFTGIAIWAIRDGRLAECWVERSALELYVWLKDRPSA